MAAPSREEGSAAAAGIARLVALAHESGRIDLSGWPLTSAADTGADCAATHSSRDPPAGEHSASTGMGQGTAATTAPCAGANFLPDALFPPSASAPPGRGKGGRPPLESGPDTAWWNWAPLTKVTVNGCGLTCIEDARIASLLLPDSLTWLEARSNHIAHLPSYLLGEGQHEGHDVLALAHLDLADNQVSALPSSFFPFLGRRCRVQRLDLSDNRIPDVPRNLGALAASGQLLHLNLSGNHLTSIPASLYELTSLVTLKLARNQLTALPPSSADGEPGHHGERASPGSLYDLVRLVELDLSDNHLHTLLPALPAHGRASASAPIGLPKLRALDAKRNRLQHLLPALPTASSVTTALAFPALQDMCLAFNGLESLEHASWTGQARCPFPVLQSLDVRDNKLQALPAWLLPPLSAGPSSPGPYQPAGAPMLRRLDVSNNNLAALDPRLALLPELEALSISGNMLRGYPTTSAVRLLEYLRSKLPLPQPEPKELGLDGAGGSQMVAGMQALHLGASGPGAGPRTLDLSGRDLALLPADFFHGFPCLPHHLSLARNQLTCVPGCLVAGSPDALAQTLTRLDLSSNRIQALDVLQAAHFPMLEVLDLSRNRLRTFLVPCCESMPRLVELQLAGNALQEVPPSLHGHPSLRTLGLRGNGLTQLVVPVLRSLTRLEVLDVADNALQVLPPELGLLQPQLRVLTVTGNCFRVPRPAIVERGTAAILEYLAGRIVQ